MIDESMGCRNQLFSLDSCIFPNTHIIIHTIMDTINIRSRYDHDRIDSIIHTIMIV